jgi:hypothetical protein
MAMAREDFKHLQVPLAIAAILLALGGGAVAGMFKWTEYAKQSNAQAQAAQSDAAGRLARATEEEKEIRLNILQYRALAAKGIIGEERRLDWIERLAAIKTSRKLFDIRYEISEQQRLDTGTAGGADILVSKMHINLPLLHEQDLLNLLADLRAAPRGYFQVKSCSMVRGAPPDKRVLAPTMAANCELDFYTSRERPGAKVAGL